MSHVPGAPLADWFVERVEKRELRVGIVGLGYVGLPLALEFVSAGFSVVGFDVDAKKVQALNQQTSYIHRIPSESILEAHQKGFWATSNFAAACECEAILICVPTPLGEDHEPDLSFVEKTVEALAPQINDGTLVVLESTTWPGTTSEIVVPIVDRIRDKKVLRDGDDRATGTMVAFSPERENPGDTSVARKSIPKVVGGIDARATKCAAALYGAVFERVVTMSSTQAAEMTKLLENIYRVVNIALVNELKQLCLAMGIDIWEVIEAAATKPFGFQPFYPGPGIGGHCIPVDPFYLSWRAKQFGHPTKFIELAGEVNEAMPGFVIATVERALHDRAGLALRGASVLLLGIAYKRDVDDLRESPALTIFSLLQAAGAEVRYNDPYFAEVGSGRHYRVEQRSTPLEEVSSFDCVVLVTDHSAYDVPVLVEQSRIFVDTRGATRGLSSPTIVRC